MSNDKIDFEWRRIDAAVKFSNMIVTEFLKDYIPANCRHEAIRYLEFKLLENKINVVGEAERKYYEELKKTVLNIAPNLKDLL